MDQTFNCTLGRNGVTSDKREGDGCTPRGSFTLRGGYYRRDRIGDVEVPAFFNMTATQENFGWCDAPDDPNYNKFVFLPYSVSHEKLWLDSVYYDSFAVIGYNDDPVVPSYGSAIFLHVTETHGPTAGCVAMSIDGLKWVLARITPGTRMRIA
jgi:L,D-peptidoglycan transpeptidase YkuD (ErfK/YbiS/YcfS/YnhG family)